MLNVIVLNSFLKISFKPHTRSAYTFKCLNAFPLCTGLNSPLEIVQVLRKIIRSYFISLKFSFFLLWEYLLRR